MSKSITSIGFMTMLLVAPLVSADDELGQRATWAKRDIVQVKAEVDAWLAGRELDPAVTDRIAEIWPDDGQQPKAAALLDRVADTLAMAEPPLGDLVELCRGERSEMLLPVFKFLEDESSDGIVRHNLRLLYGRWLAQQRMYNEALDQLGGLKPEEVVDPATLLFYQGVCHHRLIDKENCLPAVKQLLENETTIPRRYAEVAKLIEADLAPLKEDSLDEVARLMDSVNTRLDLGRAGTRVRKEEEEIIAKLDKMIDKLEEQAKKQQSSSGNPSGNRSSNPANDSLPGGDVSGEGNVDPRRLGSDSGWGNLPPKERQEALQQISKEFPSHYREVIEEYFRKIARDGNAK